MPNICIALAQMRSGTDPEGNLAVIASAMLAASSGGARLLFLPEMSLLLDKSRSRSARWMTRESDSFWLSALSELSVQCGLWLHSGSVALLADSEVPAAKDSEAPAAKDSEAPAAKDSEAPAASTAASTAAKERRVNRSLLFSEQGEVMGRYDKIHLFDVDLPSGESWRESALYVPGCDLVVSDTPAGVLGFSICFDVRFPELYRALACKGAIILSVPAAFTVSSGEAHWHILVRARAIETGCYVVAAAQSGLHSDGRRTYGHSLIVDPWGRVLADLGQGVDKGGFRLAFAEVDFESVAQARRFIPLGSARDRRCVAGL